MNLIRLCVLAGVVPLLTGCPPPSIPNMVDPFANLQVSRPPDDRRLADLRNGRLALILSENTKNVIAWQNAVSEHQKDSVGVKMFVSGANRESAQAVLDPAYVVNRVSGILRTNFPNIALASDLHAAERTGAASAVIFDLQRRRVTGALTPYISDTWSAGFHFFRTDGSKAVIREVVARKSGSVSGSGNEFVRQVLEMEVRLRTEVFDELDASLAQAMR